MAIIHVLLMLVVLVGIIANLIATSYGIIEAILPKYHNLSMLLNLIIHLSLLFMVEYKLVLNLYSLSIQI